MVLGIMVEAGNYGSLLGRGKFGWGFLSGFCNVGASGIEMWASALLAIWAAATFTSEMAWFSTVEAFVVFSSFVAFLFSEFLGLENLDIGVTRSWLFSVGISYSGSRSVSRTWSGTGPSPHLPLLVEKVSFIYEVIEGGWCRGNSNEFVIKPLWEGLSEGEHFSRIVGS